MPETYRIRRFYFDESHPNHREVGDTNLTLEEAREHCNREDTRGVDDNGNPWFDGYEREED